MSSGSALTLRTARAAYFSDNGFPPDGGYSARWVKLKFGPIPLAFPNTAERKRAVPFHDLHHLTTGYATDLVGEAEIGAWEIASGCTQYPAAVFLNLSVFGFALPARRDRIFRAFVRGRHTRNLYDREYGDPLLDQTVEETRRELGLDGETPGPTAEDRRAFVRWCAAALAVVWGPYIPLAWLGWVLLS